MNIHALGEVARSDKSRKIETGKATVKSERTTLKKADSVELRTRQYSNITLESIKAKIKSGFYNSDAVTDDVTDKLAALFEKRL
ncbi:MAG: hypothetical protein V1913_05215 [Fibrobacterota bacterium]